MFVLENLWKGRIRPSERCYREGSRYAELIGLGVELEKTICSELSEVAKKAYKELYEAQVEMIEIGEQDAFLQGVRFGAQFMLDVLREYPSQLPQVGEENESDCTKEEGIV